LKFSRRFLENHFWGKNGMRNGAFQVKH
jgi:hypothetical protein